VKRAAVALLASGLVACATATPILYENQKYREVGRAGAARDVAECRELADRAGATPGAGRVGQSVKSAGVGAVGGAAAGAVGGAIGGSPGIGAAAGSASGVVWSLFSSMFAWMTPSQPSEVHRNYVNMCLAERGYQVAGWK
jgi:outer membrane lipoprotein SlyB